VTQEFRNIHIFRKSDSNSVIRRRFCENCQLVLKIGEI